MHTILIVEDDKKYQELLVKTLTEEKYTVLKAENGKEALEIVKKEHIDLILLDLLMPEVDGVTFYYQLEQVMKKHIPIIVLTNLSDATGFSKDIKEVLVKANTSLEDVVATVKKYLH